MVLNKSGVKILTTYILYRKYDLYRRVLLRIVDSVNISSKVYTI